MVTEIDVSQFGAVADGSTDSTDAFQEALAAAGKAGNGVVRIPAGTYRLRLSDTKSFDGIRVPDGCQLVGAGAEQTILHAIGEMADANWNAIRMILVESNTRIADLTIDGDKAAIPRDRFKNKSAILLRTVENASTVLIENLHVRNQYADGDAEGFGISIGKSVDVTVRNIDVYDNDGSGISVDSANMYEKRSQNVTIDTMRGYRNGWQAFTVYGSAQVTVTNAEAYDNVRHGLNVEWSDDIVIKNSTSRNNGIRGLRVAGQSNRVRWENVTSEHNGANAEGDEGAELLIGTQTYGAKNPSTEEFETGYPQDVEVINCTLVPSSGKPHVLFGLNVEKISVGSPSPQRIIFDGPDVENWTFQSGGQPNRQIPGVQFPGLGRSAATAVDPTGATRSARAEVDGVSAPANSDRSRSRQDTVVRDTPRAQRSEKPGFLKSLARAIGLDPQPARPANREDRVRPGRQGRGQQQAREAGDSPVRQTQRPETTKSTGQGSPTVITVNGKGGYVDYPVPDQGRVLCRLTYRVMAPADWRFQLRDANADGKDFLQEVRHRTTDQENESEVWFESEVLTPPNMNVQQVVRIMCASEGQNSLELGTIEITAL